MIYNITQHNNILLLLLLLFTAIGLLPGGSGYVTCIQNIKLVATEFKSRGPHEKYVLATWNLGNHLSICFKHRETKKNLCRGGRSQDLPNTDL